MPGTRASPVHTLPEVDPLSGAKPPALRNPTPPHPHIPPHATGRTVVFTRVAPLCTVLHPGSETQKRPFMALFGNPSHLSPKFPVRCTRTQIAHTVTHRQGEIPPAVCAPYFVQLSIMRERSLSPLSILYNPDPLIRLYVCTFPVHIRCTQGAQVPSTGGTRAAQAPSSHLFSAVCGGRRYSPDGITTLDDDFSHGTPPSPDRPQHSGDRTPTPEERCRGLCVFCCTSVQRETRLDLYPYSQYKGRTSPFLSRGGCWKNLRETCRNAVRVTGSPQRDDARSRSGSPQGRGQTRRRSR